MQEYLSIVNKILESDSPWKGNRTKIRTKSIYGAMFKHDMQSGFPLLTTKYVPILLVASELEFFIKGLTDKRWLQERGNHIWDEWANPKKAPYGHTDEEKAAMKSEPDLGKIYGYQWRNFGGVDQLKNVIETIKSNPTDRRMIVSAWNPPELDEMALPPCHVLWQVFVTGNELDTLNLIWYQRSVDVMLGLPFNIASYALLLVLLSKETDKKPGRLVGFLGDTHIYENHVGNARKQLSRTPYALPQIEILNFRSIYDWQYTDIEYTRPYLHYPRLHFEIAV